VLKKQAAFDKRIIEVSMIRGCVLADRLYVPEEHVNQEILDEFVYTTEESDSYEYGAFETVVGTIRTFIKVRSDGHIFYAFSKGNIEKLGRLFGHLPWEDKTAAPKMASGLAFKGKLFNWDDDQIGQQEATDEWLKCRCGIINAPPRFGKTITSIYLMTKVGCKTVIIAHQKDLLEQYYKSFTDFTNVKDVQSIKKGQHKTDATGRVYGYFDDYYNPEELDVCLLCWQTFASKYGDARIEAFCKTWGTVIVDECHPYNTPVLIDYDKYMSIGEVYENPSITHVLSYNLDTKQIERKKIVERRCHESERARVSVRVRGERGLAVISPTDNHKYYVSGKGYVQAKDLCSGDKLITLESTSELEVEAVTDADIPKDKRVYNLEVENNHNYFVMAHRMTEEGRIKRTTTPILVSNCHKLGGICYAKVINRLHSRHRMGLTGTVERVDGREFLLKDIIGPVVARGKVKTIPCEVEIVHTGVPIKYTFAEPLVRLYKRIYRAEGRMDIVLKYIYKDVQAGRYICFAFHRQSVADLVEWTEKLQNLGFKAEAFYGSCKDRKGVLKRARSGETQILVCNSQMLTGIDVPRWDAYYSAFPTSNVVFTDDNLSGNFYQEFSRIRTPFTYEDGRVKKCGIIRDFVDTHSFCYGSYRKRYKAYENQGFNINVIKLKEKKVDNKL
jgi:superfamily II DNA or RNA helicase